MTEIKIGSKTWNEIKALTKNEEQMLSNGYDYNVNIAYLSLYEQSQRRIKFAASKYLGVDKNEIFFVIE